MNKVIFVFKKKKIIIIIIIKEQATKQNGKQPIFQSSPPPTPSPAPPPSRILTYTYTFTYFAYLPSLTVTKTLRLTEKLLLRSKEGSFLYCSLTTVLQTAQNADLLLCFIDVHAVFQNATQQLY